MMLSWHLGFHQGMVCAFSFSCPRRQLFRALGTGSFLAHFTPAHTWLPGWDVSQFCCESQLSDPAETGSAGLRPADWADKPWSGAHLALGLLCWSGVCVRVCACSLPPSLIPSHQILHFPDWILLSSLSRRDYFLLNSCLTHDTFNLTVPANSMYMRPIHNCVNGRWSGALCSSSSLSFLSHLITSHTVRFTAQFLCL